MIKRQMFISRDELFNKYTSEQVLKRLLDLGVFPKGEDDASYTDAAGRIQGWEGLTKSKHEDRGRYGIDIPLPGDLAIRRQIPGGISTHVVFTETLEYYEKSNGEWAFTKISVEELMEDFNEC